MAARATSRRFGHPEVFAGIAALSFLVARFVPVLWLPWTCPARGLLGIPCATCGMTHAFVALAHGDLAGALHASPAGALLAGGAWLLAVADAVRLALGLPVPSVPAPALRAGVALGVAVLLLNWAWLLAGHGSP
jgi:hypothetical protein